ncbi:MAG: hypothetical protein QOI12_1596 [Alphaproteobacteria bacterium]|jgi:hypothetical protein|nr:hypothetical protein [Alphaproteobacteria bacterium]
MRPSAVLSQELNPARRAYILGAVTAGVMTTGTFAQDMTAYFLIAVPAIIPFFLWLQAGAVGIPVLPAISALFFMYYAIPVLRSDIVAYGSEELVSAAATVGSFLLAASAASWAFLTQRRRDSQRATWNLASDRQIVRLLFVGLAGGIIYYLALASGNLSVFGTSIGLVRSVVLTLTSVACYLLGCGRASGALVGDRWALALAALVILTLLALNNLILVGGVMNVVAAVLGYVITAKRVPWIGLGIAFAMLSILHAGKFEMREKYWMPNSQNLQDTSVLRLPGMLMDWFTAGLDAFTSDRQTSGVFERASLLHMLLLVQRATPSFIPYLEGESYALLPSMLVPRFVDPEKPQSQAVLNLLSMRYGLQNVGSAESTTIGWGMVAEAWANFGYPAVIVVGALFGGLCGVLMRLSAGAPPLSLPMLVTIASTLVLFNLELDFSYLMVTLLQTVAAVLICASFPRLLKGRRRIAVAPASPPFRTSGPPPGQSPSL